MNPDIAKRLAKAMALYCVRNTCIEDLHAGTVPSSQTGDHTDVKVVSPFGEIPWAGLSRLDDGEMRTLMKEVVNKLYTVLLRMDDPAFLAALDRWGRMSTVRWDEPEDLDEQARAMKQHF